MTSYTPEYITDLLDLNLQERGDKTALVFRRRSYTYAEVSRLSYEMADLLTATHLCAGDRVVAVCGNGPQMVCALFGAMRADAVFVPVHPLAPDHHVAGILNDALPRVVIADDPGRIARILDHAGVKCVLIVSGDDCRFRLIKDAQAGTRVNTTMVEDLALLLYTSGSTGRAKGVMSLHHNVLFATRAINSVVGNRVEDRILNALPFSFDYGLYQIFLAFLSGATLVLHSAAGPGILEVPRLLTSNEITGFPCVPSMLNLLLRTGLLARIDPTHLRYITSTGEILSEKSINSIRRLFPDVAIFSMYGLTECKRVSICPADKIASKRGSVGLPLPGTQVEIVDDFGDSVDVGETGELVVNGDHVMAGYWGGNDCCSSFVCGEDGKRFLHTGDIFSQDEEGYLYFHGRRDDIVKVGGVKLNLKEVQRTLSELSEVAEVCIFVSGKEQNYSLVNILVVAEAGYDENEVLRSCQGVVRAGFFPRTLKVVRELYQNENGKIDVERHALCFSQEAQ
jgi:acyl-CoA synthetase (AMP-forming)/AMP-acid ligase II